MLGGGNVAIDVARTAVRLGAAEVQLACLESRETMPAHPWEIEAAEAEGVTIHDGRSFKRILDDGRGRVGGVECLRVTFMEFDAEGRLTLETEPGSEHVISCDIVIFSIGQRAGLAFIPESAGVGTTEQGMIAVNPNTLAATRPGVFAAGDATTGTAFVIEAVANGHRVAESIHRYLRGEELEPPPKPELPVVQLTEEELQERVQRGELRSKPRVPMPLLPVGQRVQGFAEVEQGYSEEEAREEAARCLQCGICSECLSCVYTCKAEAINHDELEQIRELKVGAVILTPGYDVHDATLSQEYGFGRYPNVITSLQFERILSASGPYGGRVQRPSDGEEPKRIGIIQCVGSRDIRHGSYCSAVCCTYATKEALVAKDHAPGLEITIFYIDLRAFGKGFEALINRAKEQGVRYIRSMVSQVVELPGSRNLLIKYADESGELCEEEFELVVLSVGLRPSRSGRELAQRLGIALNDHGFAATDDLNPMTSSRRGVFIAGAFSGPKDIPETVIQASAAAARASELLGEVRGTLVEHKEYPPEKDVGDEPPRIGVFVCHCGINIAGVVRVEEVVEFAKTLPNVVHAEHSLY
ncbi:MAG: FAD-dependent oxidoreductase, partial [Candidatus Bipolaricaulia bacterium]